VIEFNPSWIQLVSLLVGVFLPLLVGLVTTKVTSGSKKAVLLAVLAFVAAILTELLAALQAGQVFDLAASLYAGIQTLVVAIALHYGVWKPTGASSALQSIGSPEHRA
jgi:small basic protein